MSIAILEEHKPQTRARVFHVNACLDRGDDEVKTGPLTTRRLADAVRLYEITCYHVF